MIKSKEPIFFKGVHISDNFIKWKSYDGCSHMEERGGEDEALLLKAAIRQIERERSETNGNGNR